MTFDDYARRLAHDVQLHAHAHVVPLEQSLRWRGRMGQLACARYYPDVPGAWERIQALALGPQLAPFDAVAVEEERRQPVSDEAIMGPCPSDPVLARLWRCGVITGAQAARVRQPPPGVDVALDTAPRAV